MSDLRFTGDQGPGPKPRRRAPLPPAVLALGLLLMPALRLLAPGPRLGFVLLVLGVALLLGSMSPFAVVIALPLVLEALYVLVEEAMLAARFGEEWRGYRVRVRRWI